MSKEQAVKDAYYEVSKTEYEMDKMESLLRQAKDKYKDALLDEVIDNILTLQKDGQITEFSLKIMINDMFYKLRDTYLKS